MNNNTTYKDSPLGKIPSDWEVKSIEDICKVFVGKDLKEENYSSIKTNEFNIPVYSNTVEKEGLYGYYNIEEFSGESLTIVGRGAGLGMAFSRKSKYGAIGRLLVLFPKEAVCAHYVTEFVNGILRIHQESGGIPQLTGEQISKYKISIPTYPEQTRIAEVLSAWDKAISNVQATIEQVELRNKWLMQELLSGKRRLKGFERTVRFHKTDLGLKLPLDWQIVKVKDIFNERKETSNDQSIFPLYSLTIENGLTEKTDRYERSFLLKNKEENLYKLVYPNDILFNPMNLRFGAIAKSKIDKVVSVSAYYNSIYLNAIDADVDFYESLFKTPLFINLYDRIAIGSLIEKKRVHLSNFLELEIPLPNKEEQTAIAQVLQAAANEVQVLRSKLDKLKEQKKGLMQVLLTGKKRLKIV